jgi:hypothetical protein
MAPWRHAQPGRDRHVRRGGFVAVRGAVPDDVLRACQEEIWSDLGDRGVLRDDPSTWRAPVVRIPCPESEAFAAAGTQPVLWEAFDQLIGEDRWWRRRGVGGTIPRPVPQPGRSRRRWMAHRGQLRQGRRVVGQLPLPGSRAPGAVPVQRRGRRQRADPGPARLAPGRRAGPGIGRRPWPPARPGTSSSVTRSWSTPRPGRTRDGIRGSWPSPAWPCITRSRWSRR